MEKTPWTRNEIAEDPGCVGLRFASYEVHDPPHENPNMWNQVSMGSTTPKKDKNPWNKSPLFSGLEFIH